MKVNKQSWFAIDLHTYFNPFNFAQCRLEPTGTLINRIEMYRFRIRPKSTKKDIDSLSASWPAKKLNPCKPVVSLSNPSASKLTDSFLAKAALGVIIMAEINRSIDAMMVCHCKKLFMQKKFVIKIVIPTSYRDSAILHFTF